MLINSKGEQVHVLPGKVLPDYIRRELREVYEPQPYKKHPFFSIEQRARILN